MTVLMSADRAEAEAEMIDLAARLLAGVARVALAGVRGAPERTALRVPIRRRHGRHGG